MALFPSAGSLAVFVPDVSSILTAVLAVAFISISVALAIRGSYLVMEVLRGRALSKRDDDEFIERQPGETLDEWNDRLKAAYGDEEDYYNTSFYDKHHDDDDKHRY